MRTTLWPLSLPEWLYNEDGISEATSLWENAPSWEVGTGRTGGKSPVQHTAPDGRADAEQLTHSWPEKISFPQVLARWGHGDLRNGLTGHPSHWNTLQRIGLKKKKKSLVREWEDYLFQGYKQYLKKSKEKRSRSSLHLSTALGPWGKRNSKMKRE